MHNWLRGTPPILLLSVLVLTLFNVGSHGNESPGLVKRCGFGFWVVGEKEKVQLHTETHTWITVTMLTENLHRPLLKNLVISMW